MNKHVKNLLVILFISIIITFAFDFFYGGISYEMPTILLNILYGFIIGISIAASGFVSKFVFKYFDIIEQPIRTYTILLLSVIFYITIDVFTINAFWYHITQGYPLNTVFTNSGALMTSLLTIFIGIIIFFIILSKNFISRFIDADKEIREAQEQSAKFQYETLKNQINPHFLFNSLNVLSSLIYKDADKADEFTIQLSKIYRYILDHQDDELVKLESEIHFIEKYIYLQAIRFDDNFSVDIANITPYKDKYLVPMALQLVIENVFKHNIISKEHAMIVTIAFEDNYLVISNPIYKKNKSEVSHRLGLKNIEKRYQILSDIKCEFFELNGQFVVRLPLLEI